MLFSKAERNLIPPGLFFKNLKVPGPGGGGEGEGGRKY